MTNDLLRPEGGAPQLLEKMQWLADQGFEPDRWYTPEEFNKEPIGICTPGTVLMQEETWFSRRPRSRDVNMPRIKSYAYFTESALWKLLPKKILDDKFILALSQGAGIRYESALVEYEEELPYRKIVTDLHSALLDLTIWAVKNGYLKPQEQKQNERNLDAS